MKKYIFTVFIILCSVNIYTQEMQLSVGNDFGGGVFKVNNDFWFSYGGDNYYYNEDSTTTFFAPGLSFTIRVFPDDNTFSRGFVFRSRVMFITNGKTFGTYTIGNSYSSYSEKSSENFSISDDFSTSIMDFGLGESIRYKISDRLQFHTDLGVNFTWMDSEENMDNNSSTLNYLGAGLFSDLAFQVNLTSKLYLELGSNATVNIFSSQKGKIQMPEFNIKTEYEDTGRLDLVSVAFYIQLGWRYDLKMK